MLGLIRVQTVRKGYQQTTLVGIELTGRGLERPAEPALDPPLICAVYTKISKSDLRTPGLEVIQLFFKLNSTEHEVYPAYNS